MVCHLQFLEKPWPISGCSVGCIHSGLAGIWSAGWLDLSSPRYQLAALANAAVPSRIAVLVTAASCGQLFSTATPMAAAVIDVERWSHFLHDAGHANLPEVEVDPGQVESARAQRFPSSPSVSGGWSDLWYKFRGVTLSSQYCVQIFLKLFCSRLKKICISKFQVLRRHIVDRWYLNYLNPQFLNYLN